LATWLTLLATIISIVIAVKTCLFTGFRELASGSCGERR
jgi:hypothetical protein